MTPRSAISVLVPFALVAAAAWAVASEDPGAQAKKLLGDLEAKRAQPALAGDSGVDAPSTPARPSPLDAASGPIAEARKALARAAELRALGDTNRAEIAEDAALEWAQTARELVRALETEWEAEDRSVEANALQSKADKARALLDEAIARRAKLQAQLDELDKELEARALDAGSSEAGKAPPKPKKKAP